MRKAGWGGEKVWEGENEKDRERWRTVLGQLISFPHQFVYRSKNLNHKLKKSWRNLTLVWID
jgi:hypothetical protein